MAVAFGRRSERRPRRILAERAVAEVVELLRASLPATVSIETQFNARGATVLADPTELQQVVMNLCTNGAHAMKDDGTLYLGLDTIDVPRELALSHGNALAGRYARLVVRDTGSGMDAATLERILEPSSPPRRWARAPALGLSTPEVTGTEREVAGRYSRIACRRPEFARLSRSLCCRRQLPISWPGIRCRRWPWRKRKWRGN